jgi:hypothetical protein
MARDLDRRHFLGSLSFIAGGAALGSWLPVAVLQAAPAVCMADACGDWQLDDICIAYPPYSMHMKSAAPSAAAQPQFDAIDAHWIA